MRAIALDFWNGLVGQSWIVRGLIGATVGAFILIVVPPIIGKKEPQIARGGAGGSAEVGEGGVAIGGPGGQVTGPNPRGQGGAGGAARVGGSGKAIGGAGGQVTDR